MDGAVFLSISSLTNGVELFGRVYLLHFYGVTGFWLLTRKRPLCEAPDYTLGGRLISDAEQYSELVRLYGEYGDEELIALGRRVGDLTETAQEVLKGELARRRLRVSPEVKEPVVNEIAAEKDDPQDGFGWLAPEDCITEFAESEDALAAGEMLRAEGIECEVMLPQGMDMRAPRVAVAPC